MFSATTPGAESGYSDSTSIPFAAEEEQTHVEVSADGRDSPCDADPENTSLLASDK
jgi:hypothetical protein